MVVRFDLIKLSLVEGMPEQQRFQRRVPVAIKRLHQGVLSLFAFFVELRLYEGRAGILTLRLRNGSIARTWPSARSRARRGSQGRACRGVCVANACAEAVAAA